MQTAHDKIESLSRNQFLTLVNCGMDVKSSFLSSLDLFRDDSEWNGWALKALFALAIGHILSGVIFFFAHNWFDLADMYKFSIVGVGFILSLTAWLHFNLDGKIPQALGIVSTVLVGVFLAIFGQVYQTPALIYTPFALWATFTLPFAALSRNLAHWTVWLVIALTAIFSYAETGLRLVGQETKAELFIATIAFLVFVMRVVFDKFLRPGRDWASALWFRVLYTAVFGAVVIYGFTTTFWGQSTFVSTILSLSYLSLVCFKLIYLYGTRSSLAELCLSTFIGFVIFVQIFFRVLLEFDLFGGVIGIFLMFLGTVGLVIGMAILFKHFASVLKASYPTHHKISGNRLEKNVSWNHISPFLSNEGIANLQYALHTKEDEAPWYVELFLAIAGVVAALFGIVFLGVFLALVFSRIRPEGGPLLLCGGNIFLLALFMRRKIKSPFTRHFFNTLLVVGFSAILFGIGFLTHNTDVVLWTAMALSGLALLSIKDRIIEFFTAGIFIGCVGFELFHHFDNRLAEIAFLTVSSLAGTFLLTRPLFGRYFASAGTAFLIAPALLGVALIHTNRIETLVGEDVFSDIGWDIKGVSLILIAFIMFWLNKDKGNISKWRPPLLVLGPLIFAMALLPFGGASALLLVLLGYIVGSRTLAIIGVLGQIYFLYMLYYDLSLSLGVKSYLLLGVGFTFLMIYLFADKISARERYL
ncbi:putative membrane protein [Litorimonas taeanensis]|uniref:Putative membrane protein n=1 Tax=Litorimonas taeanensis TaxID=568099 RepID=A0A420WKI6_9PROT|nr:DUF4401 domain-containing protein [Litorimonas taeanensis]RKQ71527.1 putative membrane protein [Litorimonas taeanensis]